MSKQFELTRRRMLAGLGVTGIAAAGAGLGTTAYLNDQESFTGNLLQAGTLNLSVKYQWAAVDSFHLAQNGGSLPDPSGDNWGTLDGNTVKLEANDVKPGDWAILCFKLRVDGNPAYVKAMASIDQDAENVVTEPEYYESNDDQNATNDPGHTPPWDGGTSNGELGSAIQVGVGTGHTGDSLDNEMDLGSLVDFVSTIDGYVLMGDTGMSPGENATVVGPGAANDLPFCLKFWIPSDVGNEIQGDSVTFDVGFEAVQARHNNATNPTFQNGS